MNRRARRAKTDVIDLEKLLSMLRRHLSGEKKVWHVVHIPSEQDEERRQAHRDLWTLKSDRTRVTNRIVGLLATVGVYVTVDAKLLQRLDQLMQWNGQPIPGTLRARVAREWEKVALFTTQIQALERARRLELRQEADAAVAQVRQLLQLRGISHQTAWLFVTEFFARTWIRALATQAGANDPAFDHGSFKRTVRKRGLVRVRLLGATERLRYVVISPLRLARIGVGRGLS